MGKIDVMQEAQRLLHLQPIFLHSKATGIEANAEVVEIAILDTDGRLLLDELVRPKGEIDPKATEVHGIKMENIQAAPFWSDVWPAVETLLSGRLVGLYERGYELGVMKQSHRQCWMRWDVDESQFFSIADLYARFYGEYDSRRNVFKRQPLELAAQQLGLDTEAIYFRRASEDVRLVRAVLNGVAGWKATP